MGQRLASGKRPQAKLKILSKLGENIYHSNKVFRMCSSAFSPKPKWGQFLASSKEEYSAWREWWNSPQSARWKNLEGDSKLPKAPPTEE